MANSLDFAFMFAVRPRGEKAEKLGENIFIKVALLFAQDEMRRMARVRQKRLSEKSSSLRIKEKKEWQDIDKKTRETRRL
eukprot:scaffold31254_cov72-Cyclotella_meneghiniana.AAC.1